MTIAPPLKQLLDKHARTSKLLHELRTSMPDSVATRIEVDNLAQIERTMAEGYGAQVDLQFRMAAATLGVYERPFELRAMGATARSNVGDKTFVAAYLNKAVQSAPLLRVATVVNSTVGGDLDFGFIATDAATNGIVADGATITDHDPAFDGTFLRDFAYKDLVKASNEMVRDSTLDLETLAAEHLAPLQARKFSDDLWGGAGGGTAPEGLLAGISNTVTAASASAVDMQDISNLLDAVPDANQFGGDCSILMSAGAWIDVFGTFGTTPAGKGQIGDPTHPDYGKTLFGFPVYVDCALADPATTTKSVVAGQFSEAYVIRLLPLRVEMSDKGPGWSSDQTYLRVVLRADGRRMRTAALRALVHP